MREDDELPSVRRLPTSGVHVAIKVEAGSEHNLWAGLAMDVAGSGGVFVSTFHRLALGTFVHLLVTLEGEDTPIAATGVVRWTRPHLDGSDGVAGVGIRFVDLDPSAAEKLARFAELVREPIVFELDEAPMRRRGGAR